MQKKDSLQLLFLLVVLPGLTLVAVGIAHLFGFITLFDWILQKWFWWIKWPCILSFSSAALILSAMTIVDIFKKKKKPKTNSFSHMF